MKHAVKAMRLKNPIGTIIKMMEMMWHVVWCNKRFYFGTSYEPVQQMIIVGPMFSGDIINFKLNRQSIHCCKVLKKRKQYLKNIIRNILSMFVFMMKSMIKIS